MKRQREKTDVSLKDLEEYSEPLFAPKLRPCKKCGDLTHNYFRCSRCWSQMTEEENECLI